MQQLSLKNSPLKVTVDDRVHHWLTTDPELVKLDLANNLRLHSSGCVVFQKTIKMADAPGGFKTITIYLHKRIAEMFCTSTRSKTARLVGAIDGNKLNCTVANLVYRSRSVASRQRKTSSKTGYTGVYKEHNRFRAVISVHGKSVHIGMFDTAEEAALAYNKLSLEHYGEDGKQNIVHQQNATV